MICIMPQPKCRPAYPDKISRMDALTFIDKPPDAKRLAPVYVLHGDEDFLKRQVLSVLRKVVFGSEENEFGFSTQPGDKAEFATVRSELETVPFLSPRRLVVIEAADPFVTQYRSALEKYVAKPAASDALIAWNRFVRRLAWAPVVIMVTYHLGQRGL